MSINKNDPEVRRIVKEIEEVRRINPEKHLDLSVELYELAAADGTEELKDYANCVLGDACVFNKDFMQAIIYLADGIKGLKETDEYELICRSYNELGIIFHRQGHYISAEEAFVNCIRISRSQRMYLYEAIACANLASLCLGLEDFEHSMEYRIRSISALNLLEMDDFVNAEIVANMGYIVIAYCMMKDRQKADESFHEIQRRMERNDLSNKQYEMAITRLFYYAFIEDQEQVELAKADALESFYACEDFVIYYDECMALMNFMLYSGDYAELERMISYYEACLVDEEMLNQYISIEEIKVHLYESTGHRDKMLESAYRCFELNMRKSIDIKKTFKTTISLQKEITNQRTKNLFMSAQTDTDALTGLANRRKLNVVIDELFMQACEENKSLAVELLDIDDFSNIIDEYGRAFADEVLIEFANGLKEIEGDNTFVARHNGDEFVIFYYDVDDDYLKEKARAIHELARRIAVEMGLSELAVSQGILNRIPDSNNNSWDFMAAADETLYYVKHNGKSNARLVHHMWDIKDKPWEKII